MSCCWWGHLTYTTTFVFGRRDVFGVFTFQRMTAPVCHALRCVDQQDPRKPSSWQISIPHHTPHLSHSCYYCTSHIIIINLVVASISSTSSTSRRQTKQTKAYKQTPKTATNNKGPHATTHDLPPTTTGRRRRPHEDPIVGFMALVACIVPPLPRCGSPILGRSSTTVLSPILPTTIGTQCVRSRDPCG